MATICRRCAKAKEMTLPPVRAITGPCDICNNQDEDPKGRNYHVIDSLMPGNPNEPNAVAEREHAQEGA